MAPTLYHFPRCPHCQKVRLAAALAGVEYRSREIDPADRREVRQVSGQEQVPVWVEDDGTVRVDSNRILRRLADAPGARLCPEGRRDRALTRVLMQHADAVLGPHCRMLIRRTDADGTPLDDRRLAEIEERLRDEVDVLGRIPERGPFLLGERPTLADVSPHAHLSRLPAETLERVLAGHQRAALWYRQVLEAAAPSKNR